MQEWVNLEQTQWKPVFEAAAKEHPGVTWSLSTLGLQRGTSLPYR